MLARVTTKTSSKTVPDDTLLQNTTSITRIHNDYVTPCHSLKDEDKVRTEEQKLNCNRFSDDVVILANDTNEL